MSTPLLSTQTVSNSTIFQETEAIGLPYVTREESSGNDGSKKRRRTCRGRKAEAESNSFTDALTAAGVRGYYLGGAARWLFFANFESDFN